MNVLNPSKFVSRSATVIALSLGAISLDVAPARAFFLEAGVDALRTAPVVIDGQEEITSIEVSLPAGFFGEFNGVLSDAFEATVKFEPSLFINPDPKPPQFKGEGCHGRNKPHTHCTEVPPEKGSMVDTLVRRLGDINILNSGSGGMDTTDLVIEALQLDSEELDIMYGGESSLTQVEQLKARLHTDPGVCTDLISGQSVVCDRTGTMKVTIVNTQLLSPTEKLVTFDIDSDINVPIHFQAFIDDQEFGDPTNPFQISFSDPSRPWIEGATAIVDPTDPRHTVPEPLTILGSITAVGFGAFFKRKLGQKPQQYKA
ncbi:MAG: PEP-CTERM sorting domain-containing protein [Crocosphaera sp.]